MKIGGPLDPRIPFIRYVHDLDDAWAVGSAGPRLRAVRQAAERLGDDLRSEAKVVAVRTLPLTTLIYPTKYAFNRAVPLPWPYVIMTHRSLLVQVRAEGEIKNVLFNPTDHEAARETPFFRKIIDRTGDWAAEKMRVVYEPIEAQLAVHGIAPEDVDVIAFDHFHTQDVRPLLGSRVPDAMGRTLSARFPNAYLLAPAKEWADWDDLHPMQRAWFVADGKKGVPEDRVVLTYGDLRLGDGCLLLRTPGHTSGNQTIFVHAERGVFGCSENGTSADNWAPYESRIPGLKQHARYYEVDVVLNSNTPETGADQYTSMILEKSIVDRVAEAPAFVQMFPSSEVTPSPIAPGITPSMLFRERDSGTVQVRRRAASAAARGARAGSPIEAE